MNNKHLEASRIVRNWNPKHRGNPFDHLEKDKEESFSYKFPDDGYVVQVSFTKYVGEDDIMLVRSTNWSAEDEPWGIFKVEDCREFCRQLIDGGFERV